MAAVCTLEGGCVGVAAFGHNTVGKPRVTIVSERCNDQLVVIATRCNQTATMQRVCTGG